MLTSKKTILCVLLLICSASCSGLLDCSNTTNTLDDDVIESSGSGDGLLPVTATTVGRCINFEHAVLYNDCIPFISRQKCNFFDYGANFVALQDTLQRLSSYIQMQSVSQHCKEVVMSYVCNYVYPGCAEGVPVGICREECIQFVAHGKCMDIFERLEVAAIFVDTFYIDTQCMDHNNYGFNYTTDPINCFNISGTINSSLDMNEVPITMDSLPLEVIIPIATIGGSLVITLVVFVLLCTAVMCYRRRKKPLLHQTTYSPSSLHMDYFNQPSSPTIITNPFQGTRYMRENGNNDYLLREVIPKEVNTSPVKFRERQDFPLFQLLSEDADRLGNNLRDILVPFKQLHFTTEIAQGAFGRVYGGLYKVPINLTQGNKETEVIQVAIKTIKDTQVQDSYKNIRDFVEESALMYSFDHPHVLGLIGISLDENCSPYIILPYMENGDLRTFLKNKREVVTKSTDTGYPEGLQYDMLVRVCHEVAKGMEYLASRKLVHRDLAARNCMVDGNVSVKVADFGLTRDIYETDYYIQRLNAKIPVKWMSPESLHDRISNEATDVWAYGVTCWEVFSLGRTPYPTVTNHEMLEYLEQGKRLKRPALCSDQMYALMKRCWMEAPDSRPLFTEVVEMFNGYIIPESCTPTIGNAGYKVHIKAGSSEESLLNSIVTQLKYTPANSFDNLEDAVEEETEKLEIQTPAFASESYTSLDNSYYVKMNPSFESEMYNTHYPYESKHHQRVSVIDISGTPIDSPRWIKH